MTVSGALSAFAVLLALAAIAHALGVELLGWFVCRYWRWRFKRAAQRGQHWKL